MSLTKPFINTISAFDATKDNNLPYLSVLGGDIITAYTYRVYNANTNALIYTNTIGVQNDILSSDIRTYSMQIPANTCVNNGEYYVTASTSNDITVETSSLVQSTPFTCYVTPCVSFQYDSGDGVYVSLTNGVTFSTPNVTLRIYFDTIDLNSPAILNSTKVNLYGVRSSGVIDSVYSGDIFYNEPFEQTIRGLSNTFGSSAIYEYYKLNIEGITVDGMVFSKVDLGSGIYANEITNLESAYVEYGAGGNFFATNDCANGRVEISYNAINVGINPFGLDLIQTISQDSDNIYCGTFSGLFAIYTKSTGEFSSLVSNPFGGSSINTITNDSTDVYCGGYTGHFAVYNKSSGTFSSLISTPFGTSIIYSVANDSTNVYCGSDSGYFAVYDKTSGTFGSLITTPFGGFSITALSSDNDNIYCGSVGGKFAVYDKGTSTFGSLITNPFGTSNIVTIDNDNQNVYCGTIGGKFAIYNKLTGAFGSLISDSFGVSDIRSLSNDAYNVYVGGAVGKFAIYNKSSGTFGSLIINSFGTDTIYAIATDDDNVYCAGNAGIFTIYSKVGGTFGSLVPNPLRRSNGFLSLFADDTNVYCGGVSGQFTIYDNIQKTFSSLISTPFGTSDINSVVADEVNVYCGGADGKFAIYNKSSGTFGSLITTPISPNDIYSICGDDINVYCAGVSGRFAIYNKSSGSFGGLVTNPFGANRILFVSVDDNNVYCGGAGGKFAIYNKTSGTFGSLITTPFGGFSIYTITNDSTNVYIGGASGKFAIYNKGSGTFGGLIATPFGSDDIRVMSSDFGFVYCGSLESKMSIYNKESAVFGSLINTPFGLANAFAMSGDEINLYYGTVAAQFAVYNKAIGVFIPPTLMLLQRKLLEEDNNWIDLQEVLFTSFKVYDTYNQNGVAYEYRLIAKQNSNVGITCSVLSQFGKSYICDSQTLYDITNELAYSSTDFVQETTLYSPIGSEFPFFGKNAKTKYNKGSATALLFAPTTRSGYVDRMAQVKLVKEFNSWLTNGTCKVLKDINGNIGIYFIQNSVNNNYYKELGNGLAGVSFEYIEAGRFTQLQLQKLGMLNNFLVIYV